MHKLVWTTKKYLHVYIYANFCRRLYIVFDLTDILKIQQKNTYCSRVYALDSMSNY